MPAGLRQQPLAGIDQHDGEIGRGGTSGHVARVLLVPGTIGDDELALFGIEKPVGDIDGDALLALGGEAIDKQRKVDLAILRAETAAIRLQRDQLIIEQPPGIVQQPANQSALAVIDAATGDEAQQTFPFVLLQVLGDGRRGRSARTRSRFPNPDLSPFRDARPHQK